MLDGNLIPTHESFMPGADARWPASSIVVGYLEPAALRAQRVRDSLDILVPTGSANLFATFRDRQGQARTALVRAPLVSVVPPGTPHALAEQPGARTLVLGIARAVFARAALAALDGAEPALREPHAAADPLLRHVADALEVDVCRQRPFDASYLESLAVVLSMHVARHYAVTPATGGSAGGLAPHKLQRVREFIAQHLGETITVEQLSRVAHLSPFHFARMFKQSTGQSPHLHVLMQRIERAKQLLTGTETALVEVAAEVGFRTQGHFTGVFHRYTGCTPRAFRLNARAVAATSPQGAGTGAAAFRPAAGRP
jgi:AraC family transcriptional regulator